VRAPDLAQAPDLALAPGLALERAPEPALSMTTLTA
jgi:hypothetical protein